MIDEKTIHRSLKEAEENLLEQIYLLETSCILFDNGQLLEALNIATRLRVLLHDTHKSTTLLKQLNLKDKITYFDTATPYKESNIGAGFHLLNIVVNPKYQGFLYRNEISEKETAKKTFEEWWKQQIVITNAKNFFGKGINLTREKIILYLVNKDGGAHIDKKIPEEYYKMTRGGETGLFSNIVVKDPNTGKLTSQEMITDKQGLYHSVRGIAFEFLVSLKSFNNNFNLRTIKFKKNIIATKID